MSYSHSIKLDDDKCTGCTNCMKRCPTQAIRIRKGKAQIISARCIDCGECIRYCPYHAKHAVTDSLDIINNFKIKVIVVDPSFFGQFKDNKQINLAIANLKAIGFDYVYTVEKAAKMINNELKEQLKDENIKKPIIASMCPTVIRLIQIRFPELLENLSRLDNPAEVTAKIVKEEISKTIKLDKKDIGVFYLTPCAAYSTYIKYPLGLEKSDINGAISFKDLYKRLLAGNPDATDIFEGMNKYAYTWGKIGGQVTTISSSNPVSVDGIDNVISVLNELENGRLEEVDYLELTSCTCGCVGGPLNIENNYIGKNRLKKLIYERQEAVDNNLDSNYNISLNQIIEKNEVLKLDADIESAMKKLQEMKRIQKILPGLDCGFCGAPTCNDLAEDITRGEAKITDCVAFKGGEHESR